MAGLSHLYSSFSARKRRERVSGLRGIPKEAIERVLMESLRECHSWGSKEAVVGCKSVLRQVARRLSIDPWLGEKGRTMVGVKGRLSGLVASDVESSLEKGHKKCATFYVRGRRMLSEYKACLRGQHFVEEELRQKSPTLAGKKRRKRR